MSLREIIQFKADKIIMYENIFFLNIQSNCILYIHYSTLEFKIID